MLLEPLSGRVQPVQAARGESPSLHLYAVHIDCEGLDFDRDAMMRDLNSRGIGSQVHYIPVYRQPYFTGLYGPMRLPGAEAYYSTVLALPLFPAMTDRDVERVAAAMTDMLLTAD